MATLKARRGFSGPDGSHNKDDIFEVDASRVTFLTSGGYADVVPLETADPEDPVQAGQSANPNAEKSAKSTTSKGKS